MRFYGGNFTLDGKIFVEPYTYSRKYNTLNMRLH